MPSSQRGPGRGAGSVRAFGQDEPNVPEDLSGSVIGIRRDVGGVPGNWQGPGR